MNIVLFAGLLALETGLIVYTKKGHRDLQEWSRNRLLVNGAGIAVFLVMTLLPGIDFSFRFIGLMILLVLRLLIGGFGYLLNRKKNTEKKMWTVIMSGVLSGLLLVVSLVPSFVFMDYKGREVTGSYEIALAEGILIDHSRTETFEEDGSYREIPVHVYYPKDGDGEYPLVIFSHGSFGYYKSNYSTYAELVSNGYVVVSLDHPYHAFFTKDTSGKTITVNTEFLNDVMYINSGKASEQEICALSSEWLALRTADIGFVLDTLEKYDREQIFDENWYFADETNRVAMNEAMAHLNTEKIGLIGHSLGGAASEALGRQREDVDAVIDLDGTMLGDNLGLEECEPYEFEGIVYNVKYVINEEPYPVPLLNVDNQEHHDSRITAKEIGMPYANNVVMEHASEGYDTYFANAGHMNFTDLPLFSPVLAKMLGTSGTGTIDAGKCIDTVNGLVRTFFDSKLKDMGDFEVKGCYGD